MSKQIIKTDEAPAPVGPYNQAILYDGTLYVSGQIPLDAASGQLIEGDIKEQTHQVMKNMGAILRKASLGYSSIIKCSIFLQDIGDFSLVNEVYGSYFDEATAPVRETIQVAALPKGALVEISCIAAK